MQILEVIAFISSSFKMKERSSLGREQLISAYRLEANVEDMVLLKPADCGCRSAGTETWSRSDPGEREKTDQM